MRYVSVGLRAVASIEICPNLLPPLFGEFINGDLLINPQRVGKALRFDLEGYHSARRGMYRVIYRILDEEVVVEVIKISHRGDVYI